MYLLPLNYTFKNSYSRDFPGGLVVKTRASTAKGMGLIPGQGTNILHENSKFCYVYFTPKSLF